MRFGQPHALAATFFLLLLVCWPIGTRAQSAQDLIYITEPYYPYNYKADGQIKGLSVDVLRLVWRQLGIPPQPITIMPWARGYKLTQVQPGTVLFSMARTPEREELFRWVGPIHTVRFVLKGKKSKNYQVKSMADLHGMAIGTLADDVGDVLLGSLADHARIEPVADTAFSLKMLEYDRIDLMAYEEKSFDQLAQASGLDPNQYETVFVLKETGVYYALNSQTSQELVDRMQQALNVVRASPGYEQILTHYLSDK